MDRIEQLEILLGFIICSEINGDAENCNRDWCNKSCSFRLPRLDETVAKLSEYIQQQVSEAEKKAREEARKEVGFDLEEIKLIIPGHDSTCLINHDEHKWWRAIMKLRHGESLKEWKERLKSYL